MVGCRLPVEGCALRRFATLAQAIPEFVDGLIDVARRGRSLGVHMVLATQSPAAITDAIRNITDLRVALRVSAREESVTALGVPDAGWIPQGLPGRAYVKAGESGQLVAFQSADSGALTGGGTARVSVRPFRLAPPTEPVSVSGTEVNAPTDLRRLCAGIAEAAAGMPAPRRPWLPALGGLVALDEVTDLSTVDGRVEAVIGLADTPSRQAQAPAVVDFDRTGHVFVYGMAGSGKTTALVTSLRRSPPVAVPTTSSCTASTALPAASSPSKACPTAPGSWPGATPSSPNASSPCSRTSWTGDASASERPAPHPSRSIGG